MTDYTALLPYANTPRQQEILEALILHGSQKKAAEASGGIARQSVGTILDTIKRNKLRRLDSPEHGLNNPVPQNFTGDFTLQRDSEGKIERSWIKGKLDKATQEEMYINFIEGLSAEIKPAKKTKKINPQTDLLASAIIFGDAHLGMLANAIETLAEDHNLVRATEDIRLAIDYCIECAPPSEEGWFINVGDFTHADGTGNTTHAGTPVDLSERHNQVIRAAGLLIRYCVDKMLTKFNKVIVINARGNHDKDAAFGLNLYCEAVYEHEPRVEVQGNDSKFNFIEFGNCLIGINHGDGINANRLAGVMTRGQAEAWGRTTFKRWWMGHIHHKQMFEHDSGVTLESFHTLAPIDAWHSGAGYGSERRVTMITLHKQYGEVNRMSPSLELIRAQQQVYKKAV
tara:strand:+ start:684 stop:1880 length:1197 start_codon:yes stop_codon:yes gene_type:complete